MPKHVLVLGAGHNATKGVDVAQSIVWTLDMEPSTKPDIVHDLERLPWPMDDSFFDEVRAYEVLEHFGQQGDFKAFFAHFGELWRILKPGGRLYASCPAYDSVWAFGDPGHTRVISPGSLVFLQRKSYEEQLGKTAMSDYRRYLVGDWQLIAMGIGNHSDTFNFILEVIK
jgi:SAM-dependent methyltransferase